MSDFKKFKNIKPVKKVKVVCFTEYEAGLPVDVIFISQKITSRIGEEVEKAGLRQMRIAETEKFAHVTYFFDGGKIFDYKNEEKVHVLSKKVRSYAELPEMSAQEVTDKIIEALDSDKKPDFILVNYANPDMVGHTGNLQASIKAVKEVDNDLSKVIPSILQQNGTILVTADHGNAEEIVNLKTGEIDKEHSNFPVPFIVVNNALKNKTQPLSNDILHQQQISGVLSDIAPTVLSFLKLRPNEEMNGINLAGKLF